MFRQTILSTALAIACAGGIAAAQAPAGQQPGTAEPRATTPQSPAPATTAAQAASMTVVGCLYNERDVPGRTPNPAERAGVLEDYILAVSAIPGQRGSAGSGSPGAAVGTSGSTSAGAPSTKETMYKVENIADDRLKALVGKRVEVTGRIDPEGGRTAARGGDAAGTAATPDRGLGPDQINLPEFEATSIREVPGTCATTPAAR